MNDSKMTSSKRLKTNDKRQPFKVLFIGDIVGDVGRRATKKVLKDLRKKHDIDFVIANGEHLSERVGVNVEFVREMHKEGIDFFTTGNHVWRRKDFEEHIGKKDVPVIRPANFQNKVSGKGYQSVETKKGKLLIINLLGREAINGEVDSPFDVIDKILASETGYDFSILDFHAEMSSEKVAMGQYLNGRVSAVVGTHTHVPSADARILPGGTAFASDVGMTGPINSVLGVRSDIIIDLFKTGGPKRFELAEGECVFNSVLITFGKNGRAKTIKRIDQKIQNS